MKKRIITFLIIAVMVVTTTTTAFADNLTGVVNMSAAGTAVNELSGSDLEVSSEDVLKQAGNSVSESAAECTDEIVTNVSADDSEPVDETTVGDTSAEVGLLDETVSDITEQETDPSNETVSDNTDQETGDINEPDSEDTEEETEIPEETPQETETSEAETTETTDENETVTDETAETDNAAEIQMSTKKIVKIVRKTVKKVVKITEAVVENLDNNARTNTITLKTGEYYINEYTFSPEDDPDKPVWDATITYGIIIEGDVTLIIKDGMKVTIRSLSESEEECNDAGILVCGDNSLTIDAGCDYVEGLPDEEQLVPEGTGTLVTYGGGRSAGIGGTNNRDQIDGAKNGCNITINSCNIYATGGYGAAGIGGSAGGYCENITINAG